MFPAYANIIRERGKAYERAVEDHKRWIRRAWPDHVRSYASRGRVPTAAEIITEIESIGWRIWGDEASSRARYEPIREAFEDIRLADLRKRIGEAL